LRTKKTNQTEKMLQESERKFKNLAEKSIVGIYVIQDFVFKYVNAKLAEIFGYKVKELIGITGPQQVVHPEDWPMVKNNIQKRILGEVKSIQSQFKGIRKDGQVIFVEVYGSGTIYEGKPAVIGTLLDITERKKVEDELKRLNEFNKAIIDNAPVAIFTLDKNGVFTSVNPALAKLSGLDEDAEKKLLGFNWLKNPYTINSGLAEYIKRGLNGESFYLWDFPFVTYKGDRSLYMDFKGVPLFGKDGSVEGLLCIIEETTERVKTRAKFMQEVKMATLGRLVAGIAHDLNNPLATLVAYAELASSSIDSLLQNNINKIELEDLKANIDIILEQAFCCKNAINDLLNITKKNGLESIPIDLNSLIEETIKSSVPDNIVLIKKFQPSLPLAVGDINAIRQVFKNIIKNAVDAVEDRIDAAIIIKTSLMDEDISIEISDNGIGIPDSIIDKIFEPFFTTKEAKKGIGLGLSICKELLDVMGGKISVKSTPRKGTTFFIKLPVKSL